MIVVTAVMVRSYLTVTMHSSNVLSCNVGEFSGLRILQSNRLLSHTTGMFSTQGPFKESSALFADLGSLIGHPAARICVGREKRQ